MNALTGEYLPLANSGNLPERSYYVDGYKLQPDPSHPENEPVKLNISLAAQSLIAQTEGEFLPPATLHENNSPDNKKEEKSSSKNKAEQKESSSKELKTDDSGDEATVQELKARDTEVRAHELKHLASAGQYASGGIVYDYQAGPDGRLYAVGGHVSVNTGSVSGDPEASLQKARVLRATAMSVSEPSSADSAVAQKAAQMESDAMAEIAAENSKASESASEIARTYGLNSEATSTFNISA